MTEENKDPLSWLDTVHPHYQRMIDTRRWPKWRAVLEEMERDDQKMEFLPKTEVELEADYQFRIKASEFLGGTNSAIDQLTGAVFGIPAKIDVENEDVRKFLMDCDGLGTTITDFFEDVSREAQGMGIAFIGIDKAKNHGSPARRLDQESSGSLRCFLTQYIAEEVRNWGFDENGTLAWVIIGRVISAQRSADAPVRYFAERRMIDSKTIRIFTKEVNADGSDFEEENHYAQEGADIIHGVGEVPVVPLYGQRIGPNQGWSMVAGSIRADIAKFNQQSWLDLALYRHANSTLVIKSDRDIEKIVLGSSFRLFRNEEAEYIEPQGGAFEAREKALNRLDRESMRQSGSNPSATSDAPGSTTGESGIAQRVRFTHTEQRRILAHGRWMAESMRKVISIEHRYVTGSAPTTEPNVTIFSTFESLELDDMISIYQRLQFMIPSRRWHTEYIGLLSTKSLPTADEKTKAEIIKENAQLTLPQPNPEPETVNAGT